MYNGGGTVYKSGQESGFVFLEKDWDGGPLPYDLVEQAGMLATNFSLVDPIVRASVGSYVKVNSEAMFFLAQDQLSYELKDDSEIFLAAELNNWDPFSDPCRWRMSRGQDGWSLLLNWDELAKQSPFAFKFVTCDHSWLEPNDYFESIETSEEGVRNFIFDSARSGHDIIRFDFVHKARREGLEYWRQVQPDGEFGYSKQNGNHIFRLFAPRATQVDLLLYDKPYVEEYERIPLIKDERGSWSLETQINVEGKFYKYAVFQKESDDRAETFEKIILDPYCLATVGRFGPGIILPHPDRVPKSSQFQPPPLKDLVIMEAHVRDLVENIPPQGDTRHRAWFQRLKDWVTSDLSYLKKSGVNAIELQPIQEFDARSPTEYHWGYMPVNFFAPASTFSSDPISGAAIHEFKELVQACHDSGVAVILDVVYNHIGVPGHLLNLDRELYFRLNEDGHLQNFSGCGNDLNCESYPVRKLVLDSLVYLVEVFDVDGFRFDLGELLGAEFLSIIESKLRSIKPSITLIAEPWSFRGRLPSLGKDSTFSLWSDECREKVYSFICGQHGEADIVKLLQGELDDTLHPWHSVNYIESHDDFSFVDRICEGMNVDPQKFPVDIVSKNQLALFLVLFSPGVPMFSAGQDFMRHKNGHRNTYQRGDLNALEYTELNKYEELSTEIHKLIKFRLSREGEFLRPEKKTDCNYYQIQDLPTGIVAIEINYTKTGSNHCIVINYTDQEISLRVPEKWVGEKCLLSGQRVQSTFSLPGFKYNLLKLTP